MRGLSKNLETRRRARKASKGQTALETAFVFSMLLFMAFALVNFGIKFHSQSIANYAAFMAARSYQVFGNMEGADLIEEMAGPGGEIQPLLKEIRDKQRLPVQIVAEDIYTCALPWIKVPDNDAEFAFKTDEEDLLLQDDPGCMEGKRKYQAMNAGDEKKLTFSLFKDGGDFGGQEDLEDVPGAFAERGRSLLRYGILSIRYRSPIVMDPLGVFTANNKEDPYVYGSAYTPVVINSGLSTGIDTQNVQELDKIQEAFEEN